MQMQRPRLATILTSNDIIATLAFRIGYIRAITNTASLLLQTGYLIGFTPDDSGADNPDFIPLLAGLKFTPGS